MSHTPEPWRAEWQPGQTPNHTYTHCVMCGDDSLCDTLTKADAYRIVACVNALAGVADPAAQVAKWRAMEDGMQRMAAELAHARGDDEESFYTEWRRLSALTDANPIAKAAIEAALAAKGGE